MYCGKQSTKRVAAFGTLMLGMSIGTPVYAQTAVYRPSTPFDSNPTSGHFFTSGDYRIDGVTISGDAGGKWGGPVGTGAIISYSFPGPGSVWANPYEHPWRQLAEPYNGLGYLSDVQKSAVRKALQLWQDVANIVFVEVQETPDSVGDIRFALTESTLDGLPAHSSGPNPQPRSADVWFLRRQYENRDFSSNHDSWLLLHEIGHSLGLVHTFVGPYALPEGERYTDKSVMAYDPPPGSRFRSTQPMPYDILAITWLYGEKGSNNIGIEGRYTYHGSNGPDQLFGLGGDDHIHGNGGDDLLFGGNGNDYLYGGNGIDTAIYDGPVSAYQIRMSNASRINKPQGSDGLYDVERLQFKDAKLALDLNADESAGGTLRIIAAAFGKQYLQPELIGIGINIFDTGMSRQDVCTLVANSPLFLSIVPPGDNTKLVNHLYVNVMGQKPSSSEVTSLLSLLEDKNHPLAWSDLICIAAFHPSNESNIDLTTYRSTGVKFE